MYYIIFIVYDLMVMPSEQRFTGFEELLRTKCVVNMCRSSREECAVIVHEKAAF